MVPRNMLYMSDIALSLEIIALAIGVALYIWALRSEGAGKILAKITAIIVILAVIVPFIDTAYVSNASTIGAAVMGDNNTSRNSPIVVNNPPPSS